MNGIESLALYAHIPFCQTRCPYCDFNTYAGAEELIASFVKALRSEIATWSRLLGRPAVGTVFFGGGTPSYLSERHVGSVLARIHESYDVATDSEVTLEANPDDVTNRKLAAYLEYGINRLSIGVQSLEDRLLDVLGRRHSAAAAVEAYRRATAAGFDNVSVDLMYGLPGQSIEDWRRTLDGLAALDPPHVSMYCLTLEEGTQMDRWVKLGQVPEPDADLAADMYLMAREVMGRRGYRHYEISNWSRPGFESRHNLTYWRNQPYLGVGPGAHSYLLGHRLSNLRSPREYIEKLEEMPGIEPLAGVNQLDGRTFSPWIIKAVPTVDMVEAIDARLEMAETLMMGLRLDTGVGIDEFSGRFGTPPEQVYGETIAELATLGLLETCDGRLRLTPRGRMLGNEVFGRFLG